MKKGFFIVAMFFAFCGAFLGCSKDVNSLASQNISEKVLTYFCGVGEGFKASLSSGQRETPYTYNGIKGKLVDFAVLTISCDCKDPSIEAQVEINDERKSVRLEVDIVTGEYLVDLEKFLVSEDVVKVKYKENEVELECKSKDFKVSLKEALKIGNENFLTELENLSSKNELLAEIYLRVLSNSADNFSRTYWYYYIFAQNGTTMSCVIDTTSGEIIVKN